MKTDRILFLSFLWIKEVFKKPLTWLLYIFFFLMMRSFITNLIINLPLKYQPVYFSSIIIPFFMIVLNTMSIDFVFNLSLKDGLLYYLLSTPLKISELILSKVIALFSTAIIFIFFVILYISIENVSLVKYTFLNSWHLVFNSFLFYFIILSYIFYLMLKKNFISPYINRIILVFSSAVIMYLTFITDGFKKNALIIEKIPFLIFCFNIFCGGLLAILINRIRRYDFLW